MNDAAETAQHPWEHLPAGPSVRPTWIWPWRPPRALALRTFRTAWRLGDWLGPLPRWLAAGLLIGVVPLLAGYLLGWPISHPVSALLLVPFLAAAVVHDAPVRGLATVALAYAAHGALTILLVVWEPERMAALFPAGAAYWDQTHDWLVTGQSEEYTLGWWLPAHLQLLGAMLLFSYLSLGFVPLWQGFHEVDLMNCYVGYLLIHSHNPWIALTVGWHPWSLSRGAGYLFITFEVTSISLQRLTGVPLSTARRRLGRWGIGLALLFTDGVLKYFLLEPVRRILAGNLS